MKRPRHSSYPMSLEAINEKPRPTWERGPGLSWLTAYVAYSVRMPGGSQMKAPASIGSDRG
jgi:hypothetical protein